MVNIEELKRFESLNIFSENELSLLASIGQIHIFSEDKKIFEQNTYLKNLYLMVSGEISLTYEANEKTILILSSIKPGTFFGISSLCGVKTFHTAYCFKPSEVVVFPVDKLEEIFLKNLDFGFKFYSEMIKFYHKITQSRTEDVIKNLSNLKEIKHIDLISSIVDFSV